MKKFVCASVCVLLCVCLGEFFLRKRRKKEKREFYYIFCSFSFFAFFFWSFRLESQDPLCAHHACCGARGRPRLPLQQRQLCIHSLLRRTAEPPSLHSAAPFCANVTRQTSIVCAPFSGDSHSAADWCISSGAPLGCHWPSKIVQSRNNQAKRRFV